MAKIDNAVQEDLIQKTVGIKIRELRKAEKMNAIDLASKAGISQGQLSKIRKKMTDLGTLPEQTLGEIEKV
jgi:transcriptional regulator with XRE-family HTH domain